MSTNPLSRLSDSDLVAEVNRLARCERETTASLVSHLAEFDCRRLYLGAGFSSLFMYCTEVLRLSEHEAYNRIEAARATRRFPALLDLLRQGRVNLTTVRLLAPHLTDGNHQELVAAAAGKSKREVEDLLARHSPRPAIPSSVRRLPSARAVPASSEARPHPEPPSPVGVVVEVAPVMPALPARRPSVNPLAPDRYAIKFTASARTCEKLRLAQDLLRHVIPNGDPAEIFDRALTVLLEDLARKKLAATQRPAADRGHSASSRHIPARVKRAVWLRDGGRCAFTAQSGRRCSEHGFLEFHHVKPYAAGGDATIDNIQLRCRPHNSYEAEVHHGLNGAPTGGVIKERTRNFGEGSSLRNELGYASVFSSPRVSPRWPP
jgi:HNH endonuclease